MEKCPEKQEWVHFEKGEVSGKRWEEMYLHWPDCDACRSTLQLIETLQEGVRGEFCSSGEKGSRLEAVFLERVGRRQAGTGGRSPRRWIPWKRVSAALLLFSAGGIWFWNDAPAPAGEESVFIGPVVESEGWRKRVTEAGEEMVFPAGVRWIARERTTWRRSSRDAFPIMESGEVEIEVPPGLTGIRMETAGGTVDVLGTRFRVRILSLPRWAVVRGEPVSILVSVAEGRIRLKNGEGAKVIGGGKVGVMFPGEAPASVEPGEDPGLFGDLQDTWVRLREAWLKKDGRQYARHLSVMAMYREKAILALPEAWRMEDEMHGWLVDLFSVIGIREDAWRKWIDRGEQ